MVAPYGNILSLRPRWPVSRYAFGKIILRQRWEKQVVGNTCTTRRLPNPSSLSLHLTIQKSNQPFRVNSLKRPFFREGGIDLYLFRLNLSDGLYVIFDWVIIPSSLDVFTHLCIPVSLQCTLLLLPQFTKIHIFHNKLSSTPHSILYPPRIPI